MQTLLYKDAIKTAETVKFARTWMEPENIILSQVTQTQSFKYCMLSLVYSSEFLIFMCAFFVGVSFGQGNDAPKEPTRGEQGHLFDLKRTLEF